MQICVCDQKGWGGSGVEREGWSVTQELEAVGVEFSSWRHLNYIDSVIYFSAISITYFSDTII